MSPSSARQYELVVFWGDQIRTFELPSEGEVTLGRAEDSTVCIDDPSVSRQHARLRVGETLEIEDLGGANGTFVRERRTEPGNATQGIQKLRGKKATLLVGDSFMFGTVSAVVRHPPAVLFPDLGLGPADAPGIVVRDAAMRELYAQAVRAARSSISVLLLGETGVGKEVLARALHAHSPRAKGPFMGINCAALSETLLEGELFGSEKGAFTGAVQARAGLLEAANGGTVFLDEVGELPFGTQAKLLRVVEERVVMRLGSSRATPLDVRFVAATNRDIDPAGTGAGFRKDLYFRLNGITLTIPPLRQRPEEIEVLARTFLASACEELELDRTLLLAPRALELLRAYAWPGNVRELRNVIDRAAVLCTSETIAPEDLPQALLGIPSEGRRSASPSAPPEGWPRGGLPGELKSLERARIVEVLERCRGNQTQAAALLGLSRRTLVARLAEYGLPRPRKRDGSD